METDDQRPAIGADVHEVRGGQAVARHIDVIMEEPLSLEINGQQAALLMRLPGMEKELATGFCISEGLVRSFDDLLGVHHCGQGLPAAQDSISGGEARNRVQVTAREEALDPGARHEVIRLVRAGCGSVDLREADLSLRRIDDGVRVRAEVLQSLPQAMLDAQELRRTVGGVHAAGIFAADGSVVVVCEDIGRHNAVDKAIGHCLLRGIALADKVLLCTGRLSYEMVMKAIRAGFPVLASITVPTSLAVNLAVAYNLTLVCHLRGERMTIYAHPQRVAL